ncbi:hypothetical protein [Alteromonas oceanisediminis]|uniref:hypothetical protein n=1 Tax=Alteromonas oceanisediminis TaxID=2836180 RepID=UPI001BDA3236|nr:hypothetical protein [Alteromonas oceanisediminis]MBT0586142.1 hypothetical protein [Alteromonas oceanisediminis]
MKLTTTKRLLSLVSIAICYSASAQTPTPTADDVSAEQVFQISSSQDAGTGGGGPWVAEQESRWKRGEITGVEVCFGSYVENITVFYGGVRGTKMGGAGSTVGCEVWKAPQGSYLKSIYLWSGVYMDAIQFHPSEGEPSKRFGGGGGGRSILEDPNNGAIRKIDAKSGMYLDRIKVHFGLPYYINNINADYAALQRQIANTRPERIDLQTVDACQSNAPARQNIVIEKRLVESHSFKFSNTNTIGLKTSVEGGFAPYVKFSAETSFSAAFTVEKANAFETASTYTRNVSAEAGPGEKIQIITVSKIAKLDLPYTYDLVHYRNGNRRDVVNTQSFNGVYKGNQAADTNTRQVSVDCTTGEPIDVSSPAASPATSQHNDTSHDSSMHEEWSEEEIMIWIHEETEDIEFFEETEEVWIEH